MIRLHGDTALQDTLRGPRWIAALIGAAFFIGLGGWAATAPLTSAAVAPGFIGVEALRKSVQHLEGGIVGDLLVKEGDQVAAGQMLIRLDSTVAQSTYDLLEGQFIDMVAEQARLEAERAGHTRIDTPLALADVTNPDRADRAMAAQRNLFISRKSTLDGRVAILQQQIGQLEAQAKGFDVQKSAATRRREIIAQEIDAVARMVRQGLEREPRLLALQRAAAEIDGILGELDSSIAQSGIRINETRLEMLDLKARMLNQVTGDLRDLSGRIADMEPRLRAARATLTRTEIRAPVNGTVVGLLHHTIGGVIGPGARILDIVPEDAELLIEAQIDPADIDVVRIGMPAEIRLTAFLARTTPSLPGRVRHVSADRLADRNGRHFYAVHVKPDLDAVADAALAETIGALYPGMPVEVMVVTGRQTVLDYLVQPVVDSLSRAFREN